MADVSGPPWKRKCPAIFLDALSKAFLSESPRCPGRNQVPGEQRYIFNAPKIYLQCTKNTSSMHLNYIFHAPKIVFSFTNHGHVFLHLVRFNAMEDQVVLLLMAVKAAWKNILYQVHTYNANIIGLGFLMLSKLPKNITSIDIFWSRVLAAVKLPECLVWLNQFFPCVLCLGHFLWRTT